MNRPKVFSYTCTNTSDTLTFYKVELEQDFELLYKWMHKDHVAKSWQLNKPYAELLQYFQSNIAKSTQELFILSVNGFIFAYAEVYMAYHDRLADFYACLPDDYGVHILIGDETLIGRGYSRLCLRALSDYIFSYTNANRVLLEPNVEVKQLAIVCQSIGFSNMGQINLPEKVATVYAVDRYAFYSKNPKIIQCEIGKWPIVRLHFPSYPTDQAVSKWLNQLDLFLSIKEPYIVISSFDQNYQFSQQARKEQVKWFKSNKEMLKKYCLAFLRVTTDQEMIAKLKLPAMGRGMPFQCIACSSIDEAMTKAQKMLDKNNI